jgi:hypothetical protein
MAPVSFPDTPFDPMHQVYKGIVALFLALVFDLGACKRPRIGLPPRINVRNLNCKLKSIRVPSEFSRRTRDIDVRTPKGEEFRNLLLAMFPTIAAEIPRSRPEHEIWMLMAILTRACIFPGDSSRLTKREQSDGHNRVYYLWEKTFGAQNCTYNVHMFSHLPMLRDCAPITELSTFGSEASYANYRDRIKAHTPAADKQVLVDSYTGIEKGTHKCARSLRIKGSHTKASDDTLFYTQDFTFYRAEKAPVPDSEDIHCRHIERVPYDSGYEFNFTRVGAFIYRGVSENVVMVPKKDVQGKAILVPGKEPNFYIVALPVALLNEGH